MGLPAFAPINAVMTASARFTGDIEALQQDCYEAELTMPHIATRIEGLKETMTFLRHKFGF